MAWTVDQSGTASISNTTETTLGASTTNNGTFVLKIDLNALAAGEQIIIRLYTNVLSAGTERVAWQGTYGALAGTSGMITPVISSPPQPSNQSLRCTAQFVATPGASRSLPWALLYV